MAWSGRCCREVDPNARRMRLGMSDEIQPNALMTVFGRMQVFVVDGQAGFTFFAIGDDPDGVEIVGGPVEFVGDTEFFGYVIQVFVFPHEKDGAILLQDVFRNAFDIAFFIVAVDLQIVFVGERGDRLIHAAVFAGIALWKMGDVDEIGDSELRVKDGRQFTGPVQSLAVKVVAFVWFFAMADEDDAEAVGCLTIGGRGKQCHHDRECAYQPDGRGNKELAK